MTVREQEWESQMGNESCSATRRKMRVRTKRDKKDLGIRALLLYKKKSNNINYFKKKINFLITLQGARLRQVTHLKLSHACKDKEISPSKSWFVQFYLSIYLSFNFLLLFYLHLISSKPTLISFQAAYQPSFVLLFLLSQSMHFILTLIHNFNFPYIWYYYFFNVLYMVFWLSSSIVKLRLNQLHIGILWISGSICITIMFFISACFPYINLLRWLKLH